MSMFYTYKKGTMMILHFCPKIENVASYTFMVKIRSVQSLLV